MKDGTLEHGVDAASPKIEYNQTQPDSPCLATQHAIHFLSKKRSKKEILYRISSILRLIKRKIVKNKITEKHQSLPTPFC